MLRLSAQAVTLEPTGEVRQNAGLWARVALSGGYDQPSGPAQAGNQPLGAVRRWSPGYSAPKARQLAVDLKNVGLELHAGREGQRRVADVDDAMRLHARQVLVLDAQKGLLEVDLKAGPNV